MKTIKIIDLLNKIANGEEVPKKIKYLNIIYEYNDTQEDYFNEIYGDGLLDKIRLFRNLTYEIEIIEEEKEIEKLARVIDGCVTRPSNNTELMNKLNEVIDAVNELKKEK